MKKGPNILITGTPGVGKSTLAKLVHEQSGDSGLQYLSVGQLAERFNCFDGYDAERDCPILDDDKVLDEMEELMEQGGQIVDYHSCDFFPERFFDIIFVLRSDNTILYDRLAMRGYNQKKLEENIECEIMAVIRDEAKESYAQDIVFELESNTTEDMERNAEQIKQWISNWKMDNLISND